MINADTESARPCPKCSDDPRPRHPERGIVAVAARLGDLIISMPAPARHGDLLQAMHVKGIENIEVEQGFLDHRGIYLERKTAKLVAGRWGQLSRAQMEDGGDLFSEDIW